MSRLRRFVGRLKCSIGLHDWHWVQITHVIKLDAKAGEGRIIQRGDGAAEWDPKIGTVEKVIPAHDECWRCRKTKGGEA